MFAWKPWLSHLQPGEREWGRQAFKKTIYGITMELQKVQFSMNIFQDQTNPPASEHSLGAFQTSPLAFLWDGAALREQTYLTSFTEASGIYGF